jgi:multiple sugar transport system substrate-binding protein
VRPREWAGAAGSVVRRRRGLAGFLGGVAVGVALTALLGAVLPGLLHRHEGFEAGTLKILSGTDDSFGGQRQALIDQWNALGGGRPKAEVVTVAGGTDAVRDEMVARAQAGGDIDVYNLDVTLMAEFVHFDYLRPLDRDRVDLEGFLENPLRTCERDGKLWALPFNTDAALLYYRRDLLGDAPLPTSWAGITNRVEDVFAAAKAGPGAAARASLVAGYTGQFADYEGLSVNAFEAIWAAGGDVVDDHGNVVIDSAEAREGLQRLAIGFQPGNPQIILPESTGFQESEATQAFRDGKVIFMRNWPVRYRDLTGESGTPPVDFGVTRVPNRSVLGGQNLAVAAGSDQPRAAQELINFLTSPRSQQILFERGGFAATREIVYHDREVQEQYAYAETLLDAIKQARPRPDTPHYALFSKVFRQGVREALANGGQLPDGFAARLADALKGIGG